MRKVTALVLVLAVAALVGTALWRTGPEPEPVTVTVGTGPSGGVYDAYGQGLQRVSAGTGTPVRARSTPASVANIRMVHNGELDAGFTLADVAALAVAGEPPFADVQHIRTVARLYDNHTHLVVRADSPYQQITDLAGRRVSVGAADSGTEMVANRLLHAAGLLEAAEAIAVPDDDAHPGGRDGTRVQREQLDLEESAAALREGRIDAFFWSGGLPTGAVTALAGQIPIRLIDLAAFVPVLSERYGDYFNELPVPAGTYPQVPAVRTIGVPSLLVVHRDMPEEVAFELTATLFGAREDLAEIHPVALHLSPRSAIATLPVELHPGAVSYYRSIKYGHDPQ